MRSAVNNIQSQEEVEIRNYERKRDKASFAALYPHMPCTPPPGGVEDEHR